MEEDRPKAEAFRPDHVGGIEIDVGEDFGHGIIDDVSQTGEAVEEQRDGFGSDSLRKQIG